MLHDEWLSRSVVLVIRWCLLLRLLLLLLVCLLLLLRLLPRVCRSLQHVRACAGEELRGRRRHGGRGIRGIHSSHSSKLNWIALARDRSR